MAVIVPVMLAAAAASPIAQIESALTASAAGWNAGDLDRFMAIYADDAAYVTGNGVTRGKADIAAHYRASFADGANKRGALSFRTLGYRTISNVHMLIFARWTLTPADASAKPETGMTTLLFERRPAGWRIIADHSS